MSPSRPRRGSEVPHPVLNFPNGFVKLIPLPSPSAPSNPLHRLPCINNILLFFSYYAVHVLVLTLSVVAVDAKPRAAAKPGPVASKPPPAPATRPRGIYLLYLHIITIYVALRPRCCCQSPSGRPDGALNRPTYQSRSPASQRSHSLFLVFF